MLSDKEITELLRKNRERMLIAARLEEPDQVPVLMTHQANFTFPADRSEFGVQIAYFFPDVLYKLMKRTWRRYRGQFDICPEFSVMIEPSAFGALVRWPVDMSEIPVLFPCVRTPEDVSKLQVPDPYRDGLMGPTLEIYRYMKHHHPDDPIAMPFWSRGPFTLACLLTGGLPPGGYFNDKVMERMLSWMETKPAVAHELIEKCTLAIAAYIKAQRHVIGEDREFRLADDQCAYITAEQFSEFALPYLKRLYEELDHPLNIYHNCHQSNHLTELIPETKAHIFHTGPPKNCDFYRTHELIGDRICLMGNISCYDLPGKSVTQVKAECREVIERCAPGGGFILSSSTSLFPDTPAENVDAIIDSSEEYGRYPIQAG